MLHSQENGRAQAKNEHSLDLRNPGGLRTYFQKISELHRSGTAFPVDLDDVWPLVYVRKQKALEILDREFVEGEEFDLTQKGKVVTFNDLQNGVKIKARLSISALEYLIARKVKPVFEVYRRVFHSINTPINGVFPFYQNGTLGYPRRDLLVSVERSHQNGYRLVHRFPQDTFMMGRTACVSAKLARYLVAQYKTKQLQTELFSDQKALS